MIRLITGLSAKTWAIIAGIAGIIWAGLKLFAMGNAAGAAKHAAAIQEAKDADQKRADDIRADARTSVRDDTRGYRD